MNGSPKKCKTTFSPKVSPPLPNYGHFFLAIFPVVSSVDVLGHRIIFLPFEDHPARGFLV